MHRLILGFLFGISFTLSTPATAGSRDIVSRNYAVNGVCEQCKARIENAAYIKGVKYAGWNVESQVLTLKFDSSKTSPELILKSIARSGHDSEYFTASDDDYDHLPSCCRYRSAIKKH